jgi:hypothetical protein
MANPTHTGPALRTSQKSLERIHSTLTVHNHDPRPEEASGPRCPVCGQVFIRFTANRLYCSRLCQNRAAETMRKRRGAAYIA